MAVYTAVSLHTVVFKACTWPRERSVNILTFRERTGYTTVYGPCNLYTGVFTFSANNMALFTGRVHGCVLTLYTAMHGPCTRPAVNSRVHGPYTGTRPCTLSVNTTVYTVHGRVDRP